MTFTFLLLVPEVVNGKEKEKKDVVIAEGCANGA